MRRINHNSTGRIGGGLGVAGVASGYGKRLDRDDADQRQQHRGGKSMQPVRQYGGSGGGNIPGNGSEEFLI